METSTHNAIERFRPLAISQVVGLDFGDVLIDGRAYTIRNGTFYDGRTPDSVIRVLEKARRAGNQVRLDYGDPETGASWSEENDVLGTLGRSCGQIKVPLLIAPGECGGPQLLDHCIVAVTSVLDNRLRTLYRHPTYQPRYCWHAAKIELTTLPEYRRCPFELYAPATASNTTELVARFESLREAEAWLLDKTRFEPMARRQAA